MQAISPYQLCSDVFLGLRSLGRYYLTFIDNVIRHYWNHTSLYTNKTSKRRATREHTLRKDETSVSKISADISWSSNALDTLTIARTAKLVLVDRRYVNRGSSHAPIQEPSSQLIRSRSPRFVTGSKDKRCYVCERRGCFSTKHTTKNGKSQSR